ncbi:MAG: VWA domain-containing protein [Nitrospirae bacterium]|nr:VWA domain-containing protein [Nitrospirota bacterium]
MTIQQKAKQQKIKGVMDIVFCIDATGSMQPCIDAIKSNLATFVSNLTVETGRKQIVPDWRARIIYFRDLNADKDALKADYPFVSSEGELRKQIDDIAAEGGGDAPESILDALYVALSKSEWRDNALHAVIAFTDAPPIETLHATMVEPGQDKSIATVINAYVSDKFSVLRVFCPEHPVYEELKDIPRSTFEYVDKSAGDVYEGLKNLKFDEIFQVLAKTLSLSASEVKQFVS